MLRQRADKAQRYGEFNEYADAVLAAYLPLAQARAAVPAAGSPHPTRSRPQTNKPTSAAISFFKVLVRAARMSPENKSPDSYFDAERRARAILPWFPAHYRAIRGEDYGPDLYGTTASTLARYIRGEGLSAPKQAELALAKDLLRDGATVSAAELPIWLETVGLRPGTSEFATTPTAETYAPPAAGPEDGAAGGEKAAALAA